MDKNVIQVRVRAKITGKRRMGFRYWLGIRVIELGCRIASTKVTVYTETE